MMLIATMVLLFVVVSCQSFMNVDKITIYKMKNFEEVLSVVKEITDKESIRIIVEAIHDAEKLAGAVNVGDPHYKMEIGKETYYLWLFEDEKQGSMMI